MSGVKVKYWGSGGKLLTKTYTTTVPNASMHCKITEQGSLRIFKRTKRQKTSTYDQGYTDDTKAYYAAGAWHSIDTDGQ